MSELPDPNKLSNDAHETADDLLNGGVSTVKILRETGDAPGINDAILALAHVQAAQNDRHHIEQLHFLERIAEALERISYPCRRLDSDNKNMPYEIKQQQAMRDQDWLESVFKTAYPDLTDGEYQAASTHIARILWPVA